MLPLKELELYSFMSKSQHEYRCFTRVLIISISNGNGFGGIEVGDFTQAVLIQAADGEFVRIIHFAVSGSY